MNSGIEWNHQAHYGKCYGFTELKDCGKLKASVESVVWSEIGLWRRSALEIRLRGFSTAWPQSREPPWTNTRGGRCWNPCYLSSSPVVVLGAGNRIFCCFHFLCLPGTAEVHFDGAVRDTPSWQSLLETNEVDTYTHASNQWQDHCVSLLSFPVDTKQF